MGAKRRRGPATTDQGGAAEGGSSESTLASRAAGELYRDQFTAAERAALAAIGGEAPLEAEAALLRVLIRRELAEAAADPERVRRIVDSLVRLRRAQMQVADAADEGARIATLLAEVGRAIVAEQADQGEVSR